MAGGISTRDTIIIVNMGQIISLEKAASLGQRLSDKSPQLVLAGGCFDILHRGHIMFLREAKKQGDILFVLLESDESVKVKKGNRRPVNSQIKRAQVLSHLKSVDYVIILPYLLTEEEYDKIMEMIKPQIIATTAGDPMRAYKERSAKTIGAEVVDVINLIADESTTKYMTNINVT